MVMMVMMVHDGYDGYMYGGTEFMKTCNYKGHIQFYCMFFLKVKLQFLGV